MKASRRTAEGIGRCESPEPRERQRRRRSVRAAILLLMLGSAATGHAETSEPTMLSVPCRPGSKSYSMARAALDSLASKVDMLRDAQGLQRVLDDLKGLLASECFAMSAENPRSFDTSSVAAFTEWWQRGGEKWMRSYLRFQQVPATVILPPDISGSPLSGGKREVRDQQALASLLCSDQDRACGAEARGLRRRFERFHTRLGRVSPEAEFEDADSYSRPCVAQANALNYLLWRQCLEQHRPIVPALPVLDVRVPNEGWLVLREVRAADGSVHERAYDLGSGSAHTADFRGVRGGHASNKNTQRPEGATALSGLVNGKDLREATLMLLLAKWVEYRQVESQSVLLPPRLAPSWPKSEYVVEQIGTDIRGFGSNDDQIIGWKWIDANGVRAAGNIGRESDDPGEQYATKLLDVVEVTFRQQNTVVPLPAWLVLCP